jgi:hypothetical protein
MRPAIEVTHPDGRKETVNLTNDRSVVGRGTQADIRIKDSRISREHCAIEIRGDSVYIVDLGGSNGTWIGSTKILANVREPFPVDAIVHVGPAQLQRISTTPQYNPEQDLESQAFVPVVPQRPSSGGQGGQVAPPAAAVAGSQPVGQSAATLQPLEGHVSMAAGERANLQLGVTNQSKIVDHYTLSVVGLPTTWVTLPREGVELLPRQNGNLDVGIHPPRDSRTSAGIHPVNIALLNRQGQIVAETTVQLEIAAFDELVLDVRPNPYQSRSGGTLLLTIENQGNAETDYRVDVIEPSDALEINVDPPSGKVAPQQSRQSRVHVRPRKRNWMGDARRMSLTITVTSPQESKTVSPAYTQLATIPRWLPILLLLACCVIIPLFAFLAWPEVEPVLFPTETPVPTSTPEHTPTPTQDIPATQTATRAIWLEQDDDGDGLLNGEELEGDTLPNAKDTDGDDLSDFDELKKHGTDPTNQDTDGDTVPDGQEVNDGCLSPISPDTDLDGMRDDIDPDSCTGVTPTPSPVPDFALGGQVHTDENLDVMEDARMTWVKIQLRFGLGADASSTVQDAAKFKEKGFKLLLSVVGNKEELERGGGYNQAFASFLGEIAPVADGIEVWNEPNIQNEWPVGRINPADYTELLRLSYDAIKATNPRTIVISAAPAPTGVNNETVMSDDRYIKGMMDAGARNYMDCIGIHYNAGATPPGDTSGHPSDSTGHYSYYFLPMIDLYFDAFNPSGSSKLLPVCFTEIGFLTPDGFDQSLAQTGANNFLWAEGTSERDQAEWLEEALLRSCRSGKVKLFIVWNVGFKNYGEDPQAGYAILRPDEDCPSCETLSRAVGILRNEGCMR